MRYLGHDLIWEKGRQLKSFDDITYTYNGNGICTSKTIDGVEHTYVLDGAKILRETWGINELVPLYDNEDSVCGILYNQVPYYFRKNLQGDIIAITDKYGETVARYTYDAWGKCTIVDLARVHEIAEINPFRYRGYYYDSETALYYLQSRYYDPHIGRFLNGDEALMVYADSAAGYNLFAYCYNRTPNQADYTGYYAVSGTLAAIVGSILSVAYEVVYCALCIVLAILIIYTVTKLVREVSKQIKESKKKQTKIPKKLKDGKKVKTPKSHPKEFTKKKGGPYKHDKTSWIMEKSKDGHYQGEHWHLRPENGKTGDYYNISPDGDILG